MTDHIENYAQQGTTEFYYPNADLSVWLRNCKKEVKEPIEGIVSYGKIPPWIAGTLILNGPGGVDIYGQGACKHLFDAPGLLQKFHVVNGVVTYQSKFIQTNAFIRNSAAQRVVRNEFGTVAAPDPCQTIFSRIAAVFLEPMESSMSDNANISIHPFGDEIYSLSEFPFAHRIDMESLETLQTVNVHHELGIINHSAHPHIWGRKLYNIGQRLSLWHGPQYVIAEMDDGRGRLRRLSGSTILGGRSRSSSIATGVSSVASSSTNLSSIDDRPIELPLTESQSRSPWTNAKIVASIPSRWSLSVCYMHTFSITQNFFILIEQPLSIFLPTVPITQISGTKPISSCLKFYPEEDTIFHVVSRHGKKSKRRKGFKVPSFFFLHTINAFEMRDGERRETLLVVDICCYKDPSMINCMYVDALKNAHNNSNYAEMFRGRPKRFLMKISDSDSDKKAHKNDLPLAESEMIVDIGCETPKINDNFNGKPYNFFYAISSDVDRENPGTLIKVDVLRKTYETWCEPNAYPCEPIFVPRPNSQREDDGIVLSSVVYGEDFAGPFKTSLIILNATTWDLLAKIDFNLETSIPKSLHGFYFPNKEKNSQQHMQRNLHSSPKR